MKKIKNVNNKQYTREGTIRNEKCTVVAKWTPKIYLKGKFWKMNDLKYASFLFAKIQCIKNSI